MNAIFEWTLPNPGFPVFHSALLNSPVMPGGGFKRCHGPGSVLSLSRAVPSFQRTPLPFNHRIFPPASIPILRSKTWLGSPVGLVGAAATVGTAGLATRSGFTGGHESRYRPELMETGRNTEDFRAHLRGGEVTPEQETDFFTERAECV
jgi:hypothetical protein